MSLSVVLSVCGAAIASLGAFRYLRAMVKEGAKPRLSSWLAWTVSWLSMLFIGLITGDVTAALFALAGLIRSAAIVVAALYMKQLSMRTSHVDRQDAVCLAISLACLTTLFINPVSPANAVMAAMANLIATWPTIRQAWSAPHRESWYVYAANMAACIIACVGMCLNGASVSATAYSFSGPLISFVGNSCVFALIVTRTWSIRQPLVREIS